MFTTKLLMGLLLAGLLATVITPTASADPRHCLGPSGDQAGVETCTGVHFDAEGGIDCVGAYVNGPFGDTCSGV